MKPEELMIGDWVQIPEVYEEGEDTGYCQVTVIEDFEVWTDYLEELDYSRIVPIPLTPEILKKNGYVYNEDSWVWHLVPVEGFAIDFDKKSGTYNLCVAVFNPYTDTDYHSFASIKYVHELQHALKLCGVNKEVVL